jgi:hypothetical protein
MKRYWFVSCILSFALVLMVLGIICQMSQSSSLSPLGQSLHYFGGWMLMFGCLMLLVSVSQWGQQLGHEPPSDFVLHPQKRLVSFKEVKRIGRLAIVEQDLAESFVDSLKKVESVDCLDLRRANLSLGALPLLERLTRVQELRLPELPVKLRELRILQVALPACRVYLSSGESVDSASSESYDG